MIDRETRSGRRCGARLLACLSGALLFWSLMALGGEVQDLRLRSEAAHTRVVLDLSTAMPSDVFTLRGPDRLVIDLAEGRLAGELGDVPLAGSPITGIRTGARGDGTRVVLDLSGPVEVESHDLPPAGLQGHRLVLDLAASGPASAPPAPVDPAPSLPTGGGRDIVIAVDAGHGGKDPGAVGPSGTYEKDVVLELARRLARRLNEAPGFRAVLTRDRDVYVGLRRRTTIAREHRVDFFVSIHADAVDRPGPHGSSVYALSTSGASSESARWLANSENRAVIADDEAFIALAEQDMATRSALLDLSMNATLNQSLAAGGRILERLGRINDLHKPRVEQAAFVVLKSPDIPSLLVETGFISNPNEERRLQSGAHQRALVTSIVEGLRAHFQAEPPEGTLLAASSGR
ncbi:MULTISPECIES: N-acetylmuramoyl-L-alanine amidase [Halomonas]|uniref:N-acetylmuramoyl-L-alanine amidase n=1 Tax=Halomonas halophila TaxID=29573 RepID=A0ABQ0U510_9GAMM|nr:MULTISPECIES: N-acetylmuramoyl-L-alanine amidase [Halomonas]MDR5889866.1 N-acetylmuramoyl-L-alanine amidase [Halomonas salina]WJY06731.1 N-acetylmuramoyl-L-alanine amidase [Halomonas halophila]GEK72823.1 N-acetylmuramoyl-L-alanine amidase [Halomonas halophila]